ncbi:MAG: DUF5011 domain-containing protein [Lachnospiraceae bacterium]|nr:DUF5011 domain-containing protein [Lachnospiraceae bacterium]MCI1378978.1 DUF5011 domain-containing protein [Lachnospiraceae bacterium]MCI1455750.1 DUF5011 domain-containing protein [Lachnospiraceae bacterium]
MNLDEVRKRAAAAADEFRRKIMPHGSHSKNETSSDKPETVQFIPLRCPVCGADISLKSGDDEVTCEYCGTQFLVTTDSETTDEPLIRLQSMRNPVAVFAEKKKQRKRKVKRAVAIAGAAFAGLIVVSAITADTTPPTVTPVKTAFETEYGSTLTAAQLASVTDDKDKNPKLTIASVSPKGAKISKDGTEISFSDVGEYTVHLQGIDQASNKADATVSVAVNDTTAPVFQSTDPIKVDYGKTVALSQKKTDDAIFAVADDKSAVSYKITDVTIDGKKASSDACAPSDDEVTFYKPGTYEVLVKASDAYGNTAAQKETVVVQDRVSPAFTGLPKTITLKDSDQKPDYKAGIKAEDEIDGDLTGNIQIDDSAVGYGKPGSYNVEFSVKDKSGNETQQKIPVTINDTTAPQLTLAVTSFSVAQGGSKPDFLSGDTATDANDGDLSGKITADDSAVDYNTPGTYTVVYTVSDAAGNKTTQNASLTVVAPTPVPQAPAVSNEAASGDTVYVTATGTKYHRAGCRYLKESSIAMSRSDAIAQGYTPCKVCNPG